MSTSNVTLPGNHSDAQPPKSTATRYAGINVELTHFKPYEKNTLQGFCDLVFPAVGLKIKGATLHEKGSSRWIGLPARPYQENGKGKWDWVLITSWNEWHEGSEIEPSVEDSDRALKQTEKFAPRFLKSRRRAVPGS